ncbi:hypothetical protein HYC85_029349 [Camellia sinensis]|uniref:Uncharacterized protein n=1 Tax=Camellia sinensis TaxID=4442 RepID=A0A7J7G060_CAMSI|nr:hypothetical protein HYC85_029349 [Camellia sinensis]
MSKRKMLVDLEMEAFGSSSALETPMIKAEPKSLMDVKLEMGDASPFAAVPKSDTLAAERAKTMKRKTGKAKIGEASEEAIVDESFKQWESPMLYQGRPISTSDSVIAY